MAKIQDKLYNRVIEGELLEITEEEKSKLGLGKTTLFKHQISIGASADLYDVIIINNESGKYNLDTALNKISLSIKTTVIKAGTYYMGISGQYRGPTACGLVVLNGSGVSNLDITGITYYSDFVEPL